ncbi:transmembrane protein 95 [Myotis myotis]|uniref:transmembrane protein 95 n=1 Tax=Myotis myotis TaxID=51298 RepID=UPI00174DD606|nr:transmembrane protein 95 [Myotis myotis]
MWTLALSVAFLEAAQACLFCRLPAHGLSGRLARLCSQIEAQWKDCEASWNFSTFALDEESMNKVTEKTHRVLRVMEIKRSFSSLPLYWQWLQKTKFPEYNREGTDGRRAWGLGRRGVWLNGSSVPTPPCLPFQLSAVPPVVSRKGEAVRTRGPAPRRACSGRRKWDSPRLESGLPLPSSVPLSPAGGSTILYNCSTCEGFEVLCWPQKRCFPGSHDLREARILLLCVFGTILLLGVLSLVVE